MEPRQASRTLPARVAVVGSGVSGLVAAHVLTAAGAEVTLYEAERRLGGHADTHVVDLGGGASVAVDTGFIVHNTRTYPTLLRLFDELDVPTRETDMSMSVRVEDTGLEYAGAKGLPGLFPHPRNLARPTYLRMLGEVVRFHRAARALLARPEGERPEDEETLADFLARGGFSDFFAATFMRPLVAAVWSCDPGAALEYPARYLFTFLHHHGMLGVFGSPRWRTVVGGSARYVERVAAGLAQVRTGTRVAAVRETPTGVEVTDATGARATHDAAVVATHPRQALALLAEPTRAQQEVLGAMPYSVNHAQLHTDTSVLPRSRAARASWNYLSRAGRDDAAGVLVSYDMTRLQGLDHVPGRRFVVTLGGADVVDPAHVVDEMTYEHPIYTPGSVAAQRRLPEVTTARVVFAGAYHGWGFHEDGALSGLRAAEALGASWPARPHQDAAVAS